LGQNTDSLRVIPVDSIIKNNQLPGSDTLSADSVSVNLLPDSNRLNAAIDSTVTTQQIKKEIEQQPLPEPSKKEFEGKEWLFYILTSLLLFYAVIKMLFPKYFNDLFRVYFRTTLKQTQVREQLLQTPLPSLILNGFFIITGGLYSSFVLRHFKIVKETGFWQLWLYCSVLLSIIYLMKYFGVKLAGWIFSKSEAAASYIFIVFMTNKIIGVVLLPFLVLIAFGSQQIFLTALLLSIGVVAGLILYRFVLSVGIVRSQVRVSPLYFLLYLTAFEILPLLILFKFVIGFLK
jgi:hypothetical protein